MSITLPQPTHTIHIAKADLRRQLALTLEVKLREAADLTEGLLTPRESCQLVEAYAQLQVIVDGLWAQPNSLTKLSVSPEPCEEISGSCKVCLKNLPCDCRSSSR